MRILVTGGNGLLGGYILRELLQAGHQVTCYARHATAIDGPVSIVGDIADPAALKNAARGHDAIIHLAAVPGPGRMTSAKLIETNLMGTVNVLEAAVGCNAGKVVFASSGAATGFSFQHREIIPEYLPIDEAHPANPQDDYGLSKLLGELTCKRYSAAFGVRTICLRINHAWYVDREGASAAAKSGWAKGLSVEEMWRRRYRTCLVEPDGEWPSPGPPPPRKLLWAVVDARDVAQAFRLAVENKELQHEVLSITGFDTCSLTASRELIDRHFPGVSLRAPMEGFDTLVSHQKATRLLGYQPQFSWRSSDFGNWLADSLKPSPLTTAAQNIQT